MHIFVFLIHVAVGLISSSGYQINSQNKETEQAKKVSECSSGTCYQSSNAVDGDINTCTRTAPIGTRVTDQSTFWYVDLEKVISIYSIRIQFKDYGEQYVMRQRGRFAGFSLYVSNTTVKESGYLCYKNGQELPTLDFSTTCVKHGRYVIFYNERLTGTTYPTGYETVSVHTELCEVTVRGCEESGVYGSNCDLPCPINCQELRCDIVNGTCLGCTAGWTGEFCNKSCPAGYYGIQCRSECTGHCRYNKSCNHTTGLCDYGCDNGWAGIHCNTQCPAESYGPDCVYNCSGQCLSSLPCNRTTGSCDGGCNPGYTGKLCDKACSVGRYGLNCSKSCIPHCRHQSNHCNHIDGHCEHGCDDGFQGSKCEEICDDGWYGENCSARCNENCVNQSCDHITGSCTYGCKPGWKTPSCRQKIISQKKETVHAKEKYRCPVDEICHLFQSSNAVDGDNNTCTRTQEIGFTSAEKWAWWYVDLEKVTSIYSIRIQFKGYGEQYEMRQRGRFAGFSLYVSNTTIKEDGYLCYKNGQELPNLDFSTTCVKHGRYVIFYNDRLDGTTYPAGYQTTTVFTELCEVTVIGCKESGVYGYNCDLPCPNNCQELRCAIINGTCLGCTAGWTGEFCNK